MKYKNKKQLMKKLAYFTMGDGGVYKRKDNKNYQFIMNMKEENRDYIEYVAETINSFTSCIIESRKDYNKDGCNRKPQLRLYSRSHPLFTKLRNRIYTDKYKGVSEHYLKFLDVEALAILFMCDGCLTFKTGRGWDVSLNMKRLSEGDNLLLKYYLKCKLGLDWNVNKQNQYRYLRLRNKHMSLFMELINPYVLPSFRYKLLPQVR